MLISGKAKYTGDVYVIPVIGKKQENGEEASQHYKDLDIKNVRSVNCVDSKHRIKRNWMCCLLMEI